MSRARTACDSISYAASASGAQRCRRGVNGHGAVLPVAASAGRPGGGDASRRSGGPRREDGPAPPADPIEAHFGPLRQFTLANSNHPNHTAQTRALHAYLRWRNANVRHPDVLAAQRRERARVRSEKGLRWGGRPLAAAA
jgi:hypothetical protein